MISGYRKFQYPYRGKFYRGTLRKDGKLRLSRRMFRRASAAQAYARVWLTRFERLQAAKEMESGMAIYARMTGTKVVVLKDFGVIASSGRLGLARFHFSDGEEERFVFAHNLVADGGMTAIDAAFDAAEEGFFESEVKQASALLQAA